MDRKSFFKINNTRIFITLTILFWSILCASGRLDKFEYKVYDVILGLRKTPKESQKLLLVDIDDKSLNSMGPWPWPRNVMAEQLLTMKELGAETAVFDIEYLTESQKSIDEDLLYKIIKDPEANSEDLKNVIIDNDDFFARSIQFFGNTWLTINTGKLGVNYTQEELDYTKTRFLYKTTNSIKPENLTSYDYYTPAGNIFISRAVGAGFTNVTIDSDGARRRIKLFENYEDGALGQLAVAPLLQLLEPEEIIQKKNCVIFKNARNIETGIRKDIKIPLDEKGKMLIHWLNKDFVTTDENENIIPEKTSFNHNSISFLWYLNNLEKEIAEQLNILKAAEATSEELSEFISYLQELAFDYQTITDFKTYLLSTCNGYNINSELIDAQNPEEYSQYFQFRNAFFQNAFALTQSDFYSYVFADTEYEETAESLKLNVDTYNTYFDAMKEIYNGKFCFIGNTGTSTTDLGTTPFNTEYPNIGTHANIFNTIVQEDFIIPIKWYWSVIFASILTLGVLHLCKKTKIWIQNTAGISLILVMILIPVILMSLFGIYIPMIASVLIALSSFIIATISKYVTSEKDKAFLQTTFGAYVAPAVVDQIVKNPAIAKLGGKRDSLTALFSDVKTFSRFTEVINNENGEDHGAEKLVATLNGYLGALSDAIMDNNGTIDKYVGDEIVSFFGAPVQTKNNAYDACLAAIRMREAEDKFNKEHEAELPLDPATGTPYYLHSRIGLNTGNMVVGNMGTEKKLNYTIMGNNVNLASRLEGTNNVYGSWIVCSESTWNLANSGEYEGKIVARKFDCVQVINVKKPVGIYNIIGLKDELPAARIEAAELFNNGMEWYLKGTETPDVKKDPEDLKKAIEFYKKADELYPEDESSKVFIKRCETFLAEGLPEKWDGVYTMKSK